MRNIKGTFHAKTEKTKDRNGKDVTEAKESKKWQEYIKELYKKTLSDPDSWIAMMLWSLT